MCGIAGLYNKNLDKNELKQQLYKMTFSLRHRGPDYSDIWISEKKSFGFGHTRLSILDLSSAGNQPMKSESGRYVICYNGEVYNHNVLRRELNNYSFNGTSDTETLLAYFEKFGVEESLNILDGMFAIAVFDKKLDILYLARDKFGEKPIYYTNLEKSFFCFASELKAITKVADEKYEIDHNSVLSFFKYNYISNNNSIYKKIKKIPPGAIAKINLQTLKINISLYWKKRRSQKNMIKKNFNEEYYINKTHDLLTASIEKRLISDVPIGCFLSGGVDSSLVASIITKKLNKKLSTFSIGFRNFDFDESVHAKKIAEYLGTDHTEYFLSKKEIIETANNLWKIYDEPFADSSQIPTTILSKLTKQKVTVCLTGDGADEIFCGYDRYKYSLILYKLLRLAPKSLRRWLYNLNSADESNFISLFQFLLKFTKIKNTNNKINKLLKIVNFKKFEDIYYDLITNEINPYFFLNREIFSKQKYNEISFENNDFLDNMMNFDLDEYLPNDILTKVDRASMHSSLEARTPFLNNEIVEFGITIPNKIMHKNSINKYILKKILSSYLPEKLFSRPKMGFGVPLNYWLKNELKDWSNDLLSIENLNKNPFLESSSVKKIYFEFLKGKNNHNTIWSICIFQSWYLNTYG